MDNTKTAKPQMPQVFQALVQKGTLDYNGKELGVWITQAGGKQLIFDKKEDAIKVVQEALDAFKK